MNIREWWSSLDSIRQSGLIATGICLALLGLVGVNARGSTSTGMKSSMGQRPVHKTPSVHAPLAGMRVPIAIPVDNLPLANVDPTVVVYVTGAVKHPGIVTLPDGARMNDVITAAGGFRVDASKDSINLALHAEDATQVHVPSLRNDEDFESQSSVAVERRPSSVRQKVKRGIAQMQRAGQKSPRPSPIRAESKAKWTVVGDGVIVLSKATLSDLCHLPGVGKSTAQRILDKRKEVGGFKTLESLGDVKGIGDKVLAKIIPFCRL